MSRTGAQNGGKATGCLPAYLALAFPATLVAYGYCMWTFALKHESFRFATLSMMFTVLMLGWLVWEVMWVVSEFIAKLTK